MTATNQNFTLTQGDSFSITVNSFKQDNSPLVPVSASWEVREKEQSTPILILEELQINGNAVGIDLQPEETDLFTGSSYLHWLRIVDENGNKSTITKGTMKVER